MSFRKIAEHGLQFILKRRACSFDKSSHCIAWASG